MNQPDIQTLIESLIRIFNILARKPTPRLRASARAP